MGSGRKKNDERISKYVIGMDEKLHMLEKPGLYGMNTKPFHQKCFLQSLDSDDITLNNIDVPLGVMRAFLEIISNASDYFKKAFNASHDTKPIEVTIGKKKITITNYGYAIPIAKNDDGIYIPEGIFGELRSGQNLGSGDKERNGIGMYGIGSKAVNIFSKYFEIDLVDDRYGKRYVQVWRNNSRDLSPPTITKTKEGSRVTITYKLDFKLYSMKRYTDIEFMLFRRICADISFNDKSFIMLNDEKFDFTDYRKFAEAYFGECNDILMVEDNDVRVVIADPVDMKRGSHILSFVNSMVTPGGGTHVSGTIDKLCKMVKDKLNKQFNDESKLSNITPIKNLISAIVSARVSMPDMTDAAKTKLVSPKIEFNWPNNIVNKISKWGCVKLLIEKDLSKRQKLLTKTNGKKVKQLSTNYPKHIELDANYAGDKRSDEAVLFVVEGFSASAYAKILINMLEGTSYKHGVFIVGGKFVNVTCCKDKPEKLADYGSVCALKEMLGLVEGCDYSIPSNKKGLRYGKIVIITDADHDGSHIRALVINYFALYYPSIIEIGMIELMKTPMVRANKGKKVVSFYSLKELEEWSNNNSRKGWNFKFFKGLGSESKKDIEIDKNESVYLTIVSTKKSMKYLSYAFDRSMTSKRKEMIYNRQQYGTIDIKKSSKYKIDNLINIDYVDYVITSLTRAIPGIDGCKDAIRKILYLLTKEPIGKEFKLCHIAGRLTSMMDYHHGEQSAFLAMICLARNYVGSNNLPCLQQHGQFGSRKDHGDDHGEPRYLFCSSPWWYNLIFHPDDNSILVYNISEEGNKIEPKQLLPVIPIVMLNGTKGISCGYASHIPQHDVEEVCDWLLQMLDNYDNKIDSLPQILTPHFNGFSGKISYSSIGKNINMKNKRVDDTENQEDDEHNLELDDSDSDDDLDNEEDDNKLDCYYKLTTYGRYYYKNDTLIITELPINVKPSSIKRNLEALVGTKIHSIDQDCGDDYIWFIIVVEEDDLDEVLSVAQISSSIKISRITILDEDNRPLALKNTNQLLISFFKWRIKKYDIRREALIKNITAELNQKNLRYKFIKLVLNGKIIINKRKKFDIINDMSNYNIPASILPTVKLQELSEDELSIISNQVKELKKKLDHLNNTTSSILWKNDIEVFKSSYINIKKKQDVLRIEERISRLIRTERSIDDHDNSSYIRKIIRKEVKMCKKQLKKL